MSGSRNLDSHLGHWLSKIFKAGEAPTLIVLKEILEKDWAEWEKRYIRCALSIGINLVNQTEGGEGVTQTEKILSDRRLRMEGAGNPRFGKISLFKGCKHTVESRQKISKANLGKELSKEHKEKIRVSLLGNTRTQGRKASVETRNKMRASHLGKIRGPYKKLK